MTSSVRTPGWFPDPAGRHEHRWWDGERWTVQVADHGVTSVDHGPERTVTPVVQQAPRQWSQPSTSGWESDPRFSGQSWPTSTSSTATPGVARSSAKRSWIFAVAILVAIAGVGVTAALALGRTGDDSANFDGGTYPVAIESNFMRGCTSTGGMENYCRCALTHIEEDYDDLGDLAEAEQEYLRTGQLPEEMKTAAYACLSLQVQS
jgi:hypothetical protein